MDIFVKQKIKIIQEFIVDLYGLWLKNGKYNAEAERMFGEKDFENWCFVLGGYSEEYIKGAINLYHQTRNNKTAPRIRQIKEIIEKEHPAKEPVDLTPKFSKPVCPIADWQEDFDYVLKQACIRGIFFNPYWSHQEDVVVAHREFLKKPFATRSSNNEWVESAYSARNANPHEFYRIAGYENSVLMFTLAYRIGFLRI